MTLGPRLAVKGAQEQTVGPAQGIDWGHLTKCTERMFEAVLGFLSKKYGIPEIFISVYSTSIVDSAIGIVGPIDRESNKLGVGPHTLYNFNMVPGPYTLFNFHGRTARILATSKNGVPAFVAEISGRISETEIGPDGHSIGSIRRAPLCIVYDFESGKVWEAAPNGRYDSSPVADIILPSDSPFGAEKKRLIGLIKTRSHGSGTDYDPRKLGPIERKHGHGRAIEKMYFAILPTLARIMMVYPGTGGEVQIQFFIPYAGQVKIELVNDNTGQVIPVLPGQEFKSGFSEVLVRKPLGLPIEESSWTYHLFVDGKEQSLAPPFGLDIIAPKKSK